jgi:hypothetical protein
MANITIRKAEKRQGWLRIAITGPSGSGKTFSALRIAKGIAKRLSDLLGRPAKILVIDAENKSSEDYADRFDFDVIDIAPPYTVGKYIDAIEAAYAAGYDIVLLDGISPVWAGEGGLLQQKEQIDSRGGNQYTNWAPITKLHEHFRSHILHNRAHLICTMRSKQDYILEDNGKGKQAPRKVGMSPIQREGMEYEFTVCLDLAMDHHAVASKDRTSMFADGQIVLPTEDVGSALLEWRLNGKEALPPTPPEPMSASPPASGAGFSAPPTPGATPANGKGQPIDEATLVAMLDEAPDADVLGSLAAECAKHQGEVRARLRDRYKTNLARLNPQVQP